MLSNGSTLNFYELPKDKKELAKMFPVLSENKVTVGRFVNTRDYPLLSKPTNEENELSHLSADDEAECSNKQLLDPTPISTNSNCSSTSKGKEKIEYEKRPGIGLKSSDKQLKPRNKTSKKNRNGKIGVNKYNGFRSSYDAPRKTCHNCGSASHIAPNCKNIRKPMHNHLSARKPYFPPMHCMPYYLPLHASDYNMNSYANH